MCIFFYHDNYLFEALFKMPTKINNQDFQCNLLGLPFYLINPFSENFSMVINSRREGKKEEVEEAEEQEEN